MSDRVAHIPVLGHGRNWGVLGGDWQAMPKERIHPFPFRRATWNHHLLPQLVSRFHLEMKTSLVMPIIPRIQEDLRVHAC